MSKYLEFTKLAIVASSESYPPTSPVAEGKSSSGKSVHPMQQKTQGGNGSYGTSTDNSPSTTISQATTSPGPTGSTKLWAPQQQQINAHPHSSGASLMGFGSYTNLANSTTVTSTPAVNKAVAGLNTNNLEQAQVNIANTGQYGDRTTMNRTDFQTPGPVVNKVDTLASAAGVLDSCLEKLASCVYDPSESHFQRLLRKEGEKAIEAGDMDRATKLAVASNALACLESVVNEELAVDKTAADFGKVISRIRDMAKASDADEALLRRIGQEVENTLAKPNPVVDWIKKNPWKSSAAISAGTGLAATGLAAALPRIDDPRNIASRTYNRIVDNPIATGAAIGLVAPKYVTGTTMLNLGQKGPIQAVQNAASLGGVGMAGYNLLLKPDLDRGADSFTQEITGESNRTVRDNMQRNMIIGGGLGALGGLGAAYAANRLGDLGFDMGDYAKYVAGGATLGSGLGALNSSLGVNYDKDVNYLH